MRPIKFRGRVPEGYHHYGGQLVYGSLVIYPENAPWAQGYPNWIVPLDDRRSYPVDEDSVAQLVGYDRDNREVYEGDYVYVRTNRGNITFKPATMIDIHLVHTYKLKEAPDNA